MESLAAEGLWTAKGLASLVGLIGVAWFVVVHFIANNQRVSQMRQRRRLMSQGIKGPPPTFFHGNSADLYRINQSAASKRGVDAVHVDGVVSHDYVAGVFPHFHQWAKEYGQIYMYTARNKQNLCVTCPELVREMNQNMSTDLGKPTHLTKQYLPLFGNGILRSNGAVWSHQRKLIAPEFYIEKIKGMIDLMTEASELILSKWEAEIGGGEGKIAVEVRVDEDLRVFSADVIARACFGSSFAKGKEIFSKIRIIQKMIAGEGFLFKSSNFRLTKSDKEKETEKLEKEVNTLIWDTVQERAQKNANSDSKDLMQLLLDSALHSGEEAMSEKEFIIDNCKNIYFAGNETTAITASWCLVLLSLYPEWQRRIREEAKEVLKDHPTPTFDALNKMKWMGMFLQEVLRLYGPGSFVTREALKDVRLGELVVPKGVLIWTLIPTLHRDPEIWGPDAHEFKPERFAGGVANACKVPQAYIPFGVGARNCLGKNFAVLELKLILCLVLSKFEFSLSPKYEHCPVFIMLVEPGKGVYLMMNKLE